MSTHATTLKPIETRYRGYRFRSRLEARWAVFFDALGIKWEYEKEGWELGGRWYLPDFWLPQVSMWAEVKPTFEDADWELMDRLADATGYPCLLLDGPPDDINYWSTDRIENAVPDGRGVNRHADYVLSEGHNYHLTEGRFYCCTGEGFPDRIRHSHWNGEPSEAVLAARAARFEQGECPRF